MPVIDLDTLQKFQRQGYNFPARNVFTLDDPSFLGFTIMFDDTTNLFKGYNKYPYN